MANKKAKTNNYRKPRLHWFKGKLIEKISDNYKNDPKKLRKRWKNEINKLY